MPKSEQNPRYTLITGASRGFGKALAVECATRGMNLILAALPHSGLPELSAHIQNKFGVGVEILETDLCRLENCDAVLQFVRAGEFKVNILINNLGGGSTEFFASGNLEEFEKQIGLNVLSTLRLSHLLTDILQQEAPAFILNVGSLAAYFTVPQKGVYAASKSFVLSFSKTLREELRERKISVSVVCPSGMPTNPLSVQMITRGSLLTRFSCMQPEAVARIAVRGMLARKRVIIPGALNRFLLLTDKVLPFFFKRLLLHSAMKRLTASAEEALVSPCKAAAQTLAGTVPEVAPLNSK